MTDEVSQQILWGRGDRHFVAGAVAAETKCAVVAGSETHPCARCQRMVWLAPSSLGHGWIPVCIECALAIAELPIGER